MARRGANVLTARLGSIRTKRVWMGVRFVLRARLGLRLQPRHASRAPRVRSTARLSRSPALCVSKVSSKIHQANKAACCVVVVRTTIRLGVQISDQHLARHVRRDSPSFRKANRTALIRRTNAQDYQVMIRSPRVPAHASVRRAILVSRSGHILRRLKIRSALHTQAGQ